MKTIEKDATNALMLLDQARTQMRSLLYLSRDVTNEIVLDASFAELEENCKEFLQSHFNVCPDLRKKG